MLSQAFQSLVGDLKEKARLVEYMTATAGAAPAEPPRSARPSPPRDALRPGTLFANRYEVKEVLGMGGMGVVYRAFDRELREPVAIKALRPEALVGSGVALERFKQEIRLARKITHRNVVRTYDLGEVNGMYYLTMEYVEGTSLKQLIGTRGPLPVSVTLTIGKQLCRALEVAHEEGVIHRDIKPQNMVVEPSGVLKVMDFGIARLANRSKDEGLTKDGMSIGTPDYMSPEHLSGKELDARSDLYSAGVVLFECLTRRLPFDAETTFALIAKHLEEEPPDPRTVNPDVPEALAQVILKTMAKEPADRYQTAVQMHDALAAIDETRVRDHHAVRHRSARSTTRRPLTAAIPSGGRRAGLRVVPGSAGQWEPHRGARRAHRSANRPDRHAGARPLEPEGRQRTGG